MMICGLAAGQIPLAGHLLEGLCFTDVVVRVELVQLRPGPLCRSEASYCLDGAPEWEGLQAPGHPEPGISLGLRYGKEVSAVPQNNAGNAAGARRMRGGRAWNPGGRLLQKEGGRTEPPTHESPGPKPGPDTSFASFPLCLHWPGGHPCSAATAKLARWPLPSGAFCRPAASVEGLCSQHSCSARLPRSACFPSPRVLSGRPARWQHHCPLGSTASPQSPGMGELDTL